LAAFSWHVAATAEFGQPVPLGDAGDWIRSQDYPPGPLRAREQGTTVFLLDVDEKGAVTSCTVTESSGISELDATACALLRLRARFQPALDAKKRAIRSTYSNRVRWQIPQSGSVTDPEGARAGMLPLPLGSPGEWVTPDDYPSEALRESKIGTTYFELRIRANGRPSNCTVLGSSGTAALDEATCHLLMQRAAFEPVREVNGQPADRLYRNRVHWSLPDAEPFENSDRLIEFDLGLDGRVANCRATDAIRDDPIPAACDEAATDTLKRVRPTKPVHVEVTPADAPDANISAAHE
jgi:TonB family protein